MKIHQERKDQELTVTLNGRLDTTTAPLLEQELQQSWNGISTLILDLKELDYISSAGLRVILAAQKQMLKQGSMILRNLSDNVREVFEMTGFADIMTIE
ncbi:MAG: STAS domain-containing protein [Oligosphaeraceae bacterium]|nr:STAS domain-containing protein [Oligosphaeraceae bacterium]